MEDYLVEPWIRPLKQTWKLKMGAPWKRRFRIWKPSFPGSMLIFWGVTFVFRWVTGSTRKLVTANRGSINLNWIGKINLKRLLDSVNVCLFSYDKSALNHPFLEYVYPIASMYCIVTYISHKNQPNVIKCR